MNQYKQGAMKKDLSGQGRGNEVGAARLMKATRVLAKGFAGLLLVVNTVAQAQVSVGEGGQAAYNYTIAVPPGIAGLQPKLGLSYGGGTANGPVGVGWSVQGVSLITRCPATKAIDGGRRGVFLDGNDKLCLDGQRLIPTDAAGGIPVTGLASGDALGLSSGYREYRTEKDNFTRIRAYGAVNDDTATLNNGPKYFKVWTKSGQVYEYGLSPSVVAASNTLILAQGKTAAMVWPVARVSDTVGNYMDFKYEVLNTAWGTGASGTPSTGTEWNIKEVAYTGNTPTSQAPRNKVTFTYIDRSNGTGDRSEGYNQGAKNVSIRRLDSIATYVDAIAVNTVRLGYTLTSSSRSFLSSLKVCAGSSTTTCQPPVTFVPTAGAGISFGVNTSFATDASGVSNGLASLVMSSTTANYGVITADFNGDGRTDILRWSDNPAENQLYLSEGSGNFKKAVNFNITDENLFKSDATTLRSDLCYLSITTDINGDGLADIVRYASSGISATNANNCPAGKTSYAYISNGEGSFTRQTIRQSDGTPIPLRRSVGVTAYCNNAACLLGSYAEFIVADINGDGVADIFQASVDSGSVYGSYAYCYNGSTNCRPRVWWGRGDGSFDGPYDPISFYQPATSSAAAYWWVPYLTPNRSFAKFFDINNDGIPDLVMPGVYSSSTYFPGQFYPGLGDGNFAATSSPIPYCSDASQTVGDFNGDGRIDLLCQASNQIVTANGTAFISQTSGLPAGIGDTADFDGDGRTDLLFPSDTPASNKIYRSLGNGSFAEITGALGLQTQQLSKSDGTASYIMGDFTGSGSAEILLIKSAPATTPNSLLSRGFTPVDLLASVTAPSGATTSITYRPLHNSGGRYISDRGTADKATFPVLDVTLPMFVAITLTTDSGLGSANSWTVQTQYAYKGLKADYQGNGLLGFREVRQEGLAANGASVTSVTRYLQTDPYIGMPLRSETRLGIIGPLIVDQFGTLLSYTDNTFCDMTLSTGAADAASPTAPCAVPAATKLRYPYLRKSVQGGSDLDGTALPTTTTVTTYDTTASATPRGEVTSIAVTTAGAGPSGVGTQTMTRTTSNTYQADDTSGDNWIRGRLTKATVTNTVPNSLGALATTAGTAPNAIATTGDLSKAPLTAVLNAILSLLLDD